MSTRLTKRLWDGILIGVEKGKSVLRLISVICLVMKRLAETNFLMWFSVFLSCFAIGTAVASEPVYIGFDGAYSTKTSTSAQAIELGTQLAISQINGAGGVLNGRPLVLVTKDNRGIAARAIDNFIEFAKRPDVVAVYGDKYSAATVQTMGLSNELSMLSISVWGSADPISENPSEYPFVYRLSLRDQWAIPAMMQHAKARYGADRLCEVMPQTAWGRSGDRALAANLERLGQTVTFAHRYKWGGTGFTDVIKSCVRFGGQAVILIANEQEGAQWIKAMAALPPEQRLPTVSHWGVTGGDLHEMVGTDVNKVDFDVVQTFSFIHNKRPQAQALSRELLADIRFSTVESIINPVGIAQAFDMTHLLAMAINDAGSTDRVAIQKAMQSIGTYEGVIRTYTQPFSDTNHDALTVEQVLFVRLQADGALFPILVK
jgi:branched-chain amino acid transport system substrate-binding protein